MWARIKAALDHRKFRRDIELLKSLLWPVMIDLVSSGSTAEEATEHVLRWYEGDARLPLVKIAIEELMEEEIHVEYTRGGPREI